MFSRMVHTFVIASMVALVFVASIGRRGDAQENKTPGFTYLLGCSSDDATYICNLLRAKNIPFYSAGSLGYDVKIKDAWFCDAYELLSHDRKARKIIKTYLEGLDTVK